MGDESSAMNPASAEQAIFAEALRRDTAEARASYLDAACGTDTTLRRRIEALLRAAEKAGDFLEQPPTGLSADAGSTLLATEPSEKPGDRIGRYKLLEQIGEGGCGVVYMAEQEEPVRRRVALKIIKLGMDTRSVVARFEAERQALALMDHPNIAKVFDGGATQTGRPYFVMELVRGVRITEFCDEAKLSTEARLQLFLLVCQAIQHAHQKGIIHRDLKPSNILVTVNDGAPVPKVIDFGIAKATGQRLTDKTLFTHFHAFIGTPAYTSPEQAEMSSVDIDTRSDIYSLGVLLYELLTGRTPFDSEELLRSGLDEMRRTIRDKEPPRPSSCLTNLVAADVRKLTSKSEVRNPKSETDGASLRRLVHEKKHLIHLVRGDLDWIVMKCLEKDRSRRYETANGLAADIKRHLNHEPVTARPPSGMYLLQKLALRNRGALIIAATVVVALFVTVLALATSNARIRQERNQKDDALRAREVALEAARASEHQAREQLFVSLQSQAQARRNSRQMGQRIESLAALTEAAGIRPGPELRDNAIAAMAMPDIQRGPLVMGWNSTNQLAFDSRYEHTARLESDGSISIRSIQDNRELQRLKSSSGNATSPAQGWLQFSPDGRFILKLDDSGKLHLWQWQTGQLVLTTSADRRSPTAFSPDCRRFAVAQANAIVCFDPATGQERRRWQMSNRPWMLAFNPDNKRLAVGYEKSAVVSIYDADDARHLADLPVGMSTGEAVAWHPNGKLLAAAGSDPRIQIWDVEARRQVAVLEGHVQQVNLLSFHPGGEMLISASWDNVLRLWHPAPGRFLMRIPALEWTGFSEDGRWSGVIRTTNDQAQLWGVVQSQEYHTFVGTLGDNQSWFTEGDISPDGRLLSLGASDGVRLWDVARGCEVARLAMSLTTGAFRANGRELLTCGPLDGLRRWRIEGNSESEGGLQVRPSHRVPLPFAPIRMAISGDDRTVAIVGEDAGQCVLLDLETEAVRTADMPHSSVGYVAFSADAKRIATSGWHSEQVKLWDGQSGKLIKAWDVAVSARVFFTPDDRELIIAHGNEFTFRELNSMGVSRHMPRDIGLYPGYVAFTPDRKLMALEMTPGVIHLKEVASGRIVAKLEDPHGDLSTWMRFTPDGTQLIVAARYAGAIHRWDLRAIRARLKTMNLDWDWPEFSAPAAEAFPSRNQQPLRVQVVGAESAASSQPAATNGVVAEP